MAALIRFFPGRENWLFDSASDVQTIGDPKDAAESAGLRHVSDARPGVRRRRSGKGLSVRSPACRPFTEPYDRAELTADAVIHATGLVFAVAGMVWLIDEANGLAGLQNTAVWIYGAGLVAMFAMSAAYNMCPVGSAKLMLRRLDHSAIYLFIAATYTPFIAYAGRSAVNISLLVGMWAVTLIGVILKLGFPGRFDRLSIVLCLALGWSGLFAYDAVFSPLPSSTNCLILIGGVLYSVGVVFHVWDGLRFQNAIWHAFVFAAAAFQFFAVFDVVSAAVAATG